MDLFPWPEFRTIKCPECGQRVTGRAGFRLEPGNGWPHHYRADAALGCPHWGSDHPIQDGHVVEPADHPTAQP